MSTPLRVGLLGAGPWADLFHAPMVAAGPDTELVAVWARRPEAAEHIADRHGGAAVPSLESLLDVCDAVVFAVPPDVQAHYIDRVASAGKAVLLEKPLGLTLEQAEHVARVVADTGVPNQLMLTNRYSSRVRDFLTDAATHKPLGAIATFISGAILPGGDFATPWRVREGALLDLGPHVLDILDAALGPIVDVRSDGDPRRWCALTARHESGAVSQAALSFISPAEGGQTGLQLFTEEGRLDLDFIDPHTDPDVPVTISSEFAATATGVVRHELDAQRGLYLQRLLGQAARNAQW